MKSTSVLKNASWIVICKIIQSLISFVIGMITARYLGPSNFGVISYVSSVVAFALPIMQLGLNQTLVKEFVGAKDRGGVVLGTALTINILSSFFCIAGSVAFVAVANPGETETIVVCVLYSFTLLFQATEMTQYWFQSKLLSKYPSIATLVAYTLVAFYKVYLLVTEKGVVWFAVSNVIEYLIVSIILMAVYKKIGREKLSVDWKIGREMLSRSKFYILPSLMVMIFQHTDRIMIKLMIGKAETGIYSAALTCIGISGFLFSAVIDSARPVILEAKETDKELYENRVIQLYSIITYMSLAQSVLMTVLSRPLILILYGDEYMGAAGILCVAVWYVTFSYFGSVRNVWILAEGIQKYLFGINIIGAVLNIIINYFLIPILGGVGAAIASFVTQFFTNVVIGFIFPPIRPNNRLMLKGLNPMVVIGIIRTTLVSKLKRGKAKKG